MPRLPEPIRQAALAAKARADLKPAVPITPPDRPRLRDICVVEGDGLRRVMHVHKRGHKRQVLVHLCHSSPELATDWDLIVPAGEVTPYPLVVMAELHGVIWESQCVTRLGRLSQAQSRAAASSLFTDAESVEGFAHGMPLGGPDDPRRQFMVEELGELRRLVSDATGAAFDAMDEGIAWDEYLAIRGID